MARTLGRKVISTGKYKIGDLVIRAPQMVLLTLVHHIDLVWMEEVYRRTRKDGAMVAQSDGRLQAKMSDLPGTVQARALSGAAGQESAYRQGWNEEDSPIGIPTLEDQSASAGRAESARAVL